MVRALEDLKTELELIDHPIPRFTINLTIKDGFKPPLSTLTTPRTDIYVDLFGFEDTSIF